MMLQLHFKGRSESEDLQPKLETQHVSCLKDSLLSAARTMSLIYSAVGFSCLVLEMPCVKHQRNKTDGTEYEVGISP